MFADNSLYLCIIHFQTAAGMDYVAPNSTMLTYTMDSSDQPQCVTLNIVDDNALEYTENFTVSLATFDDSVELLSTASTITTFDNDGKICKELHWVVYSHGLYSTVHSS